MVVRSTLPSARECLASQVRDLNDLVLLGELDDDELVRLSAQVEALVEGHRERRRAPWWKTDAPDANYAARSPFTGAENPRSPQLVIERVADDPNAATATVTLTPAFAGPPGAAHGGVVSGLLDEVIGWLASSLAPDSIVVTARLAVRFRQPTPLNTPLTLQAEVQRNTSRRMTIVATIGGNGVETASAEALMVTRR